MSTLSRGLVRAKIYRVGSSIEPDFGLASLITYMVVSFVGSAIFAALFLLTGTMVAKFPPNCLVDTVFVHK
ncbi:hypothetical protein Bpfe_023757 [Biomphalaria pfeifferi]|uniref:Uncharacterized protein n=1 Tax=Biomphalaria pfeifferi TaxID=112525 RepID=A0AAD8B570_BIOPF|nr:hypothetical protein Bpfe_023757 [Biomphalaria pfeifferi]